MDTPRSVQRTYLILILGNTLAASLIWGINTIFLLDAGLSNLEAFAANAFFTAGMVLFEVPTGIVADTVGRRASYLLGTLTLTVSTLLYVAALADRGAVLGVGGRLDPARARLHVLLRRRRGVARRRAHRDRLRRRRSTTVFGARADRRRASRCSPARWPAAFIAQAGEPRRRRSCSAAIVLLVMFVVAFRLMHDVGFTPERARAPARRDAHGSPATRSTTAGACPPVKWLMVESLVHRRRRHLRLLRAAAVPARALRRPAGVPDRRARGRDRRRRADPRRARGAADPAPASSAAPRRCS